MLWELKYEYLKESNCEHLYLGDLESIYNINPHVNVGPKIIRFQRGREKIWNEKKMGKWEGGASIRSKWKRIKERVNGLSSEVHVKKRQICHTGPLATIRSISWALEGVSFWFYLGWKIDICTFSTIYGRLVNSFRWERTTCLKLGLKSDLGCNSSTVQFYTIKHNS
jgi:hypothetical protein